MSKLIKFSGDDGFSSGGSICSNPVDPSLFLSLGHHVDVYFPPRKRSRISAPLVFTGDRLQKKKQPSIDVLPDECLFEIFRRLPGGQERSTCASVSKRWLMLLSNIRGTELCSKKISQSLEPKEKVDEVLTEADDQESESNGYLSRCLEGKKATDTRLAAIAVGTSNHGGLGKLLIRGSNSNRGVTDLGLRAISRGCPSLRVLSLWNVPSVGDEGLCEIANGCPLLEKLDLSQCPSISDKGLLAIAKCCPNLTDLALESCAKIGNEGLRAIGHCCANLNSISIKDCPLVGDQGITGLLSPAALSLTKIKLHGLNITDMSLAVIGHYGKAATDLVFSGLQNVSEKGFWVMANGHGLQKLKALTITSCRGVTDVGLEAIGKGCPNLKQFSLSKCFFLSDSGLVSFVRVAPSLESLQLDECLRVTQYGVFGVVVNASKLKALSLVNCFGIREIALGLPLPSVCKSLRSLTIQNCPGFGDASLASMGKLCPQLQNLDLSALNGITDAGLFPLLESCEDGLVKVNLTGCINLTDKVISSIALLHGGTLEVLNLDGCEKITDTSLMKIAENCLFLTDLDVSKCSITDNGLAFLARAKNLNLQILSLSCCSRVTDKSLPSLGKLGKTLLGLNLQHCSGISNNLVDLLVERLWRCDILS